MKINRLATSSFFTALIYVLACDLAWAANTIPTSQQTSNIQGYKIAFVVGLVIAVWGLYRSKKERIVVFANLTDVLTPLSVPVIAVILYIL